MTSRLFAFGCSFTNYIWPTWADILGREFDQFENWGGGGGGNQFISNAVVECHHRRNINANDTVIVMWSDVMREDRYVFNQWIHSGPLHIDNCRFPFTRDYIKAFVDVRGFHIRDLALIYNTKVLLESIGCRYYFLSMLPIRSKDYDSTGQDIGDLIQHYQDTVATIRPSIYEVVFNEDWYSRPLWSDIDRMQERYEAVAGPDWPLFNDFLTDNLKHLPEEIQKEILDETRWKWDTHVKQTARSDLHPTPNEHLEYLDRVLPEMVVSDSTRKWANEIDYKLRTNGTSESYENLWKRVIMNRW